MQGVLVALVYILLVGLAGGTIVFMFMYVLREKHEHTEHYIPELPSTTGEEAKPEA